jgi:integrase/recombinase XerD
MDVSRAKKKLETSLRRVQALPEEQAKPILEFYQRCMRDGLSYLRINSYLEMLPLITKRLGKPLDKAVESDIERLVYEINSNTEYKDSTKALYRITLKKIYGYSWIKTSIKRHQKELPEIVSEEEALKIISACQGLRDKALLATLYDLGCRPAELLTLTIGDVSFDEWGAVLKLKGKTGPRPVRGILCSPFLRTWFDFHPLRSKPNSPLWIVKKPGKGEDYLMIGGLQTVLRKAAKAAGFNKRIFPYMFRHSRATHNASFMTESQLCAYHGWLHGSRMPSVYVHMSGRDVDDVLLNHYGFVKKEESKKESLKRCPRCTEINAPNVRYCFKCGMPMDRETTMKVEEKDTGLMMEFMELMNKEPRLLDILKGMKDIREKQKNGS